MIAVSITAIGALIIWNSIIRTNERKETCNNNQ